jgi:dCMP deaminase
MNWIEYFRNLANNVKLKSKDTKTQIGAVIVGKDNEIVSTGYNSFPRGLDDTIEERQERPEKYYWFEHAERNAIYNAARIGVSTKGTTMYLSHWFPCADCARGIINAGITTLYCDRPDDTSKSSSYIESFKRSKEMLIEADVKICFYEDEL